jgi:hypothetical protein
MQKEEEEKSIQRPHTTNTQNEKQTSFFSGSIVGWSKCDWRRCWRRATADTVVGIEAVVAQARANGVRLALACAMTAAIGQR